MAVITNLSLVVKAKIVAGFYIYAKNKIANKNPNRLTNSQITNYPKSIVLFSR